MCDRTPPGNEDASSLSISGRDCVRAMYSSIGIASLATLAAPLESPLVHTARTALLDAGSSAQALSASWNAAPATIANATTQSRPPPDNATEENTITLNTNVPQAGATKLRLKLSTAPA